MDKKGIVLQSMYIVDLKDSIDRIGFSEEIIERILNEIKYYDKRKLLKRLKPENYCFRFRLSIERQ